MKSRFWLLAAALFAGSAQAIPQYGPGPATYMGAAPAAPRVGNPAVTVRAGMDMLMSFIGGEERPSSEVLAQFLNTEIAPFFDFDYMARSAAGRLFESLGPDEQRSLVNDLKRSFLTKMAEKLSAYSEQQIRFMPPRAADDRRTARVSVVILNPGSYPSRLDFRLYLAGNRWRVFDVAANGQSAIVYYRRQLMRQVQERQMREMRQMTPPMRPDGPPPGYGRGPVR